MLAGLPAALAVVGLVELVLRVVDEVVAVLGGELPLGFEQCGLVHRPLLDRMLVFVAVVLAVGGAAVGVEGVAVGMQVVPGGEVGGFHELALVEGAVRAVGLVREAHRVLVELGHGHHPLVIARVREVVLNKQRSTAWVVTP